MKKLNKEELTFLLKNINKIETKLNTLIYVKQNKVQNRVRETND
jgi:hypothetical protein